MGVYEVTQQEYERVMGSNPSYFSINGEGKNSVKGMDTRRFPVETVSWDDAVEFCRKLSEQPEEKKYGRVHRLPTEAEWEYACRAGTTTVFHYGNSLSSERANFDGKYPYGAAAKGEYLERTTPVGSYPVNAFGLYDMHGNVWEWCNDWYGYGPYEKKDPQGPAQGKYRVFRGGGWLSTGRNCRSADRGSYGPGYRFLRHGFRVAAVQSGR